MAITYIIYSDSTDKYYVGSSTETIETRLERHNTDYYEKKYTSTGKPWRLYHLITCDTIAQAKKIELHIKSMKSRKYIENLKMYPAIVDKLKLKYNA